MIPLGNMVGVLHAGDLEHFAAETDEQHRGKIRMAGIPPLGARQHIEGFALARHAAALAVRQRHDAVDIRIIRKNAGAHDLVGDVIHDGRRTVHRGEDADIVAGTGASVCAAKTVKEGRNLPCPEALDGPGIGGKSIVALEILAHGDVLFVHPFAGLDRRAGKADDLAEFADRFAHWDRLRGDLVAARHAGTGNDRAVHRASCR